METQDGGLSLTRVTAAEQRLSVPAGTTDNVVGYSAHTYAKLIPAQTPLICQEISIGKKVLSISHLR
jgi:hypothetical protein